MMELFKLMGLCAVCILPILFIKSKAPELALLLTLAVVCAVLVQILSGAVEIWETMEMLFSQAGIRQEYVSILLRTVGAALLTRLSSDLCRDGGSQSLAAAVEFAGSAAMLFIALPLLRSAAELLLTLVP